MNQFTTVGKRNWGASYGWSLFRTTRKTQRVNFCGKLVWMTPADAEALSNDMGVDVRPTREQLRDLLKEKRRVHELLRQIRRTAENWKRLKAQDFNKILE